MQIDVCFQRVSKIPQFIIVSVLVMKLDFKEPQKYRAILVEADSRHDHFLETLLSDRGIMIIAKFTAATELGGLKSIPEADLIIIRQNITNSNLCKAVTEIRKVAALPLLAISQTDNPEAIWEATLAGADQILCIGVTVDRLRCAVYGAMAQYEKMDSLQKRAEKAVKNLEDRKFIERAKGIIMEQRGISEKDAFREMQQSSMQRNISMPDMARSIIEAKELLG